MHACNPSLWEDHKFKVIPGYITSLMLARATEDPISKQVSEKQMKIDLVKDEDGSRQGEETNSQMLCFLKQLPGVKKFQPVSPRRKSLLFELWKEHLAHVSATK